MRILHTLLPLVVFTFFAACSPEREEASLPKDRIFNTQTAPLDKAGEVEGMVLDAAHTRGAEIDAGAR